MPPKTQPAAGHDPLNAAGVFAVLLALLSLLSAATSLIAGVVVATARAPGMDGGPGLLSMAGLTVSASGLLGAGLCGLGLMLARLSGQRAVRPVPLRGLRLALALLALNSPIVSRCDIASTKSAASGTIVDRDETRDRPSRSRSHRHRSRRIAMRCRFIAPFALLGLGGCSMIERADTAMKLLGTANERLAEANKRIERADANLAVATQKLDSVQARLDQTNREIAQANGNLDRAVSGIDATNRMLAHADGTIGEANAKIDSTNKNLARASTGIDSTNKNLIRANGEIGEANKKLGVVDRAIQKVPGLRQ